MKVFFATWLFDKTLGDSLTKKKAKSRLASYHFIAQAKVTDDQMKKYVETGRFNPTKK